MKRIKIKVNKVKKKSFKISTIQIILFFIFCFIFFVLFLYKIGALEKMNKPKRKIKVGVIGLDHHRNVGNNILKYAIYVLLKELGVDPYIVGYNFQKGVRFVTNKTQLVSIKNFSQVNRTDYDILMVNSDQTWRFWNKRFEDIAFLKFAENWTIPKFVYGASIGTDYWSFSKRRNILAKRLLRNFTGISVREIGTVKHVKHFLNISAEFVLDPTLLIDKKYYLDVIKDYKGAIKDKDYILTYELDRIDEMENFIQEAKIKTKYEMYDIKLKEVDYIEKFLSGMYYCKAVITNSYHGVLFSIIFNKPFVVFTNTDRGKERFNTLKEVYGIKDRFFDKNDKPSIDLLLTPLNLNYTTINYYRGISIEYLKKNLNVQ